MSQNLRVSHPYAELATAGFEVFRKVLPFSRGDLTLYSIHPIIDTARLPKRDSIFQAIDFTRLFYATTYFRNQLLRQNPYGVVHLCVKSDRYDRFPIKLDVLPPLDNNDVDFNFNTADNETKIRTPFPYMLLAPTKDVVPLPFDVKPDAANLIRQAMIAEPALHKNADQLIQMLQDRFPDFLPLESRPELRDLFSRDPVIHRNRPDEPVLCYRPHPKEIRPKGANVIRHASVSRVTM